MNTSSQTLKVELFADYFQFYVWDKGVLPDAPTDWTEQDVANRLKTAPNVVVVCPVRNMTVPVELEVLLGSLSEDGLSGKDHYRVALWPAPGSPLRVLKQWHGANGA